MRKCDNYFAVSCYRYAPESFNASYIKNFIYEKNGNKKPCYSKINLTAEEISACGIAYCTKGMEAAITELKRIVRQKERNEEIYITYGSLYKNNLKQYCYTRQLAVPENDINKRLYAYKEWKQYCIFHDWKISNFKVEEMQFDPNHPNKKPIEKVVYDELVKDKFVKIYSESNTLYQSKTN